MVLNAAAGLVSFALAENPAERERGLMERLSEKIVLAESALDSGLAQKKLEDWVAATHH